MSKLLTEEDFKNAANILGVSVAHIKTVTEVESRGSGFLSTGEPVILFERHWFRKLVIRNGKSVKDIPISIANKTPGGYLGGIKEHARLQKAVEYDRLSALQSASWGLFQIMGFNYKACGHDTIQSFINAMYHSEGKQLEAFVNFIKSNKSMYIALKNNKWSEFAKLYNGPNYSINKYDIKLANAFKKWTS